MKMKEVAVNLSIYIPAPDDMSQEKAKEFALQYLAERGIEDVQLYEVEVRDI
jgi:hypothetical protein